MRKDRHLLDARTPSTQARFAWLDVFADAFSPAKVVDIDVLREWSLSLVVRLTLDDDRNLIAKRGIPTEGPTELEVYQECLIPLEIRAPTLLEGYESGSDYVLLMEDVGGTDLEQRASTSAFLDAARSLAEIKSASNKIGEINSSVLTKHLMTEDQLLIDLHYVLENTSAAHRDVVRVLSGAAVSLTEHIHRLYQEFPLTVNHNDYHGKNLIDVDGRIVPVDWANARVSPHAGDLYCLIEEAKEHRVPREDVVGAYSKALQDLGVSADITEWQIDMGGVCWSIHCLRWILEFGLKAIPASKDWVPDFLKDISDMTSRLQDTKSPTRLH